MAISYAPTPQAQAEPEKPRLVFSFGATEETYFIGCGEHMEWKNLPEDLEHILHNRALEVLALSLGENDAFYCRYIAKRNRTEYTVTGNLPGKLDFLLNHVWFANQYEVPHISLGPNGAYFFQMSAMTAWERIPKNLEESLMELRENPESSMPPRAVALGYDDSYVFLTGEGEEALWRKVDIDLAEKLARQVCGERRVVESVVLSVASPEDYILVCADGSIFYSVPDTIIPTIQRFVKIYHEALINYADTIEYMQRAHDRFTLELPDDILRWSDAGISKFVEEAVAAHSPLGVQSPICTPPRSKSPRMLEDHSGSQQKTGRRDSGPKYPFASYNRRSSVEFRGVCADGCGGWCGSETRTQFFDMTSGMVSL